MMPPALTAILRCLPDDAGPIAVRDFTEAALAEYHGFPLPDVDA
jgi:hypothetical protein